MVWGYEYDYHYDNGIYVMHMPWLNLDLQGDRATTSKARFILFSKPNHYDIAEKGTPKSEWIEWCY